MTRAEMLAFNKGVLAVLNLADQSAALLEARITEKPTRFNFAVSALRGLAEEGKALLRPTPSSAEPAVLEQGMPHDGV